MAICEVLTDLHSFREPNAFSISWTHSILAARWPTITAGRRGLGRLSWRRGVETVRLVMRAVLLLSRIVILVPNARLKRIYVGRFLQVLLLRPIPAVLFVYALRAAMHYHGWKLARVMADPSGRVVNSY